MTSRRAGRPGTGAPWDAAGRSAAGESRSSSAVGDPPTRSGRIAATDAAGLASSASSVAVVEFGIMADTRMTGVLPVTPCAPVRVAT